MTSFLRILILSVLLISQNCFGQDSIAVIKQHWKSIKKARQNESKILDKLFREMSESTTVDKEELNNSKVLSKELLKAVNKISFPDSLSLSLISKKEKMLIQSLTTIFVSLEKDPAFKRNHNGLLLLSEVGGCENRHVLEKTTYNAICKKYKRFDLLYS